MMIKLFNIKIYIRKETVAVIVMFAVMLSALIGYMIVKGKDEVIIYAGSNSGTSGKKGMIATTGNNDVKNPQQNAGSGINEGSDINNSNADKDDGASQADEIKVYVIGCVNNPGIVTLRKGQLIYDAIEAAGGVTENADIENINMVYKLEENVMLNILPKDRPETKEEAGEEVKKGTDEKAGSGVQIIKDEGDSVISIGNGGDKEKGNGNSHGKININTASVDELDTLPGIGKAIAESIKKYREENGRFGKIEDIMNVPGIKQGKFEQIKDFICVD